jgi:cytochrome c biogenesis protein CcmG/thiol:disulfide interchange protein DsbE
MPTETEVGAAPDAAAPQEAGEKPRRRSARVILLPIALATLGLAIVMGIKVAEGDRSLGEVKLKPYAAPDFSLTEFNGERFSLADQRGKVVVVNFWASWCVPCQTEAPILESSWRRYRSQGIVFVGVDIKDTREDALAFIQRYGVSYTNGFDTDKKIYINYGVYGLPESFLVDQQGRVLHHNIGALTQVQLDGWLAPFLAGQDPGH